MAGDGLPSPGKNCPGNFRHNRKAPRYYERFLRFRIMRALAVPSGISKSKALTTVDGSGTDEGGVPVVEEKVKVDAPYVCAVKLHIPVLGS